MSEGRLHVEIESRGLEWVARVYEADVYWRGREAHCKGFWTKRGAIKWASDPERVRRWFEKRRSVNMKVG